MMPHRNLPSGNCSSSGSLTSKVPKVRGEAANRERAVLAADGTSVSWPGTTMGATDFSETDGVAMMVLLMNDGPPTAPGG